MRTLCELVWTLNVWVSINTPINQSRLLSTCWVFTLCVAWNKSASCSTSQSWAFLAPEWAVQVLTWSPRTSQSNFLQTQAESNISYSEVICAPTQVAKKDWQRLEDQTSSRWVFYSGHDALLWVKTKLFNATRDHKGLLEVFKRLSQVDDLVCKLFLSRYGDTSIGSVLSPNDVNLRVMKTVKLRKKEGSSLLLLRYTIMGIAPRTSPHPRLSWGRCTVLAIVFG